MSDLPLVSISIITFNQIEFIRETLDSALGQDYENLEVVVSDDASTDGTAEVIQEYAQKYPGRLIALVGGPNLGITANDNRALKACRGKYIAFQGGDDVLLQGKISAQVEWFEQKQERVLCGHAIDIIQGAKAELIRRELAPYVGNGPRKFIEGGCLFGATSVMVRKQAIPEYGFRKELPWVSDTMLWIEILMKGGSFGFVEGVYALYRKHNNNITNKQDICMHDIGKMYSLLLKEHPNWKRSCNKGMAKNLFYSCGIHAMNKCDYLLASEKFWLAAKQYPFDIKTWLRILMCWKCAMLK